MLVVTPIQNWLVVYLPLWKMMEFVSWMNDIAFSDMYLHFSWHARGLIGLYNLCIYIYIELYRYIVFTDSLVACIDTCYECDSTILNPSKWFKMVKPGVSECFRWFHHFSTRKQTQHHPATGLLQIAEHILDPGDHLTTFLLFWICSIFLVQTHLQGDPSDCRVIPSDPQCLVSTMLRDLPRAMLKMSSFTIFTDHWNNLK